VDELDDIDMMRLLEEEFAELQKEVDRITAQPTITGPTVQATTSSNLIAALRALREEQAKKAAERGGPQTPQSRLDEALLAGLDRLITDGQVVDGAGNVSFRLDPAILKQQLKLVLYELINVLKGSLLSRFATKAAETMVMSKLPAPDPAAPNQPRHGTLTLLDFTAVVGSIFLPQPGAKPDKK
jgi:hypothetical protein